MGTSIRIMISLIWLTLLINCQGQGNQNTQNTKSDEPKVVSSIEEKQKGAKGKSDSTPVVINNKAGIDFRFAAHRATPAVVHVNTTWKINNSPNELRRDDPFKDFFGDDWSHFFGPYINPGPVKGSASGVILTPDGYIITNSHVIQDADDIEVILNDQRSYPAKIVGSDQATDLALIKIEENNLSFLEFGNSDQLEVGEWVLAVGNPFNLASTVTAGIVSAKARNIGILKDRAAVESFIQTDAAVNPGNSGGALVNLEGKLIGINAAIATPTGTYAGYSFAIPVNIVEKVANDLLTYGTVQRGYLGVFIHDMTSDLAKEKNIKFVPGVFVDSLVQGGAAISAGIKVKDVIVKINDSNVETSPQLQENIANHRPGEKLNVTLVRNGEEKQVAVILKAAEVPAKISRKEATAILNKLGIEVEEITSKEKASNNLNGGLKITQITQGAIREFTNIKKGFVITKVNGAEVITKKDLINNLEKNKGQVFMEGVYLGSAKLYYYGFNI